MQNRTIKTSEWFDLHRVGETALNLSGQNLNNNDLESVCAYLKAYDKITSLNLANNNINHDGLAWICADPVVKDQIISLDLSSNKMGNGALYYLGQCKNLEILDISNNKIYWHADMNVGKSNVLSKFNHLSTFAVDITDDSKFNLETLSSNQKIRHLLIDGLGAFKRDSIIKFSKENHTLISFKFKSSKQELCLNLQNKMTLLDNIFPTVIKHIIDDYVNPMVFLEEMEKLISKMLRRNEQELRLNSKNKITLLNDIFPEPIKYIIEDYKADYHLDNQLIDDERKPIRSVKKP